jgi:elongation factor G
MKVYETKQIRNVALAGHSGSGKTSLAEALLHKFGMIDRKGSVDAGNTQSDYDPLEKTRKISINATLLPIELENHKVNLLDCPGFRDFIGEIKNAIRISEMCLIVVDAETGVEVGTEFAFQFAQEYSIPIAIAINKMDKDRANYRSAMQSIDQTFEAHTIPVTLPMGSGSSFQGVIDLLDMKAIFYDNGKRTEGEIPAEFLEEAQEARRALVEAAAEGDDELTEKFLEQETLTEEELRKGLREDLQAGRFIPVVCCSAEKGVGLHGLMHFILEECPSPDLRAGFRVYANAEKPNPEEVDLKKLAPSEPFSAFVFKTVNDDYAGRLSLFKVITGEVSGDCQLLNRSNNQYMRAGHVFDLRGKDQVKVDKIVTGDIGAFAKLTDLHTGDTLADPKGPAVLYEPTHMPPPTVIMALRAKERGDEDKLSMALHRLLEQDPTLELERDSLLHQTLLKGRSPRIVWKPWRA